MTTFNYADQVCSLMAGLAIVSSLLVVGQAVRNPVNAVLWLIVAFVAVACYLITAGMTFIGLSYVIVYVGAIAVLFLFVVMMLNLANQSGLETTTPTSNSVSFGNKMWPVALLIGLTGALTLLPLSGDLSLVTEAPLSLLKLLNWALYGGPEPLLTGAEGLAPTWSSTLSLDAVSPTSQVQALGLTLYTYGALWLFLISILLMLAMIVPLALAFTP
jgi:NADH-ubiquinone oxidoreductase chain 6